MRVVAYVLAVALFTTIMDKVYPIDEKTL